MPVIPRLRFGLVWVMTAAGSVIVAICVAANLGGSARPPLQGPTPASRSAQTRSQHGPRTVHFDLLAKLLADDRRSDTEQAWREQLTDPSAACRVETQPHLLLGRPAPDFTLNDYLGQPWNLAEQLARGPVLVVFYLGYSCNACVHHLVELDADLERFRELGAQVVAVSADPPELTRERFEQYGVLGFPVLADPGHKVAERFGTFRPAVVAPSGEEVEPEQLLHAAFIIDRQTGVFWTHRGDAPFRSSMALLYEINRLRSTSLPEPVEGPPP